MKEYLVGMVCTECDQGEIEYNSIIKKYECTCCDAKFDEEELTTSQAYLDRDENILYSALNVGLHYSITNIWISLYVGIAMKYIQVTCLEER